MRNHSLFFRLSVLLNVVFILLVAGGLIVFRDRWIYRLIEWKGSARIVFFGDSMTAQGKWMELLGRTDLQNSAVPSLTTYHLERHLPYSVLRYGPEMCFFMGGINDINMGVCQDRIRTNYLRILGKLRQEGIRPVVQLTLYQVGDPEGNARVDSLNHFLVNYCRQEGIDYIDVNRWLCDSTGLKPEYARDETHLNTRGYEIWGKELKKFMELKGI